MRRKKKLEEKHHQRNRAGRLQEITDALGKLASGNFSVRLETSPQLDELDALAVGVSILAGELGSTVGELKDVMNYTDNIIRSLADSLVLVDPGANIITVNRETCELLGYSEDELTGKPVAMLFAEEEEEEEEEIFQKAGLLKLIDAGTIRNYEMTFRTREGKEIPVLLNGSVMRDEDGNIVGVLCIARDVTEPKRTEDEIRRLSKRIVDEHEEARRKIAVDLHDEVGQSLNAFKLELDMLRNEEADNLQGRALARINAMDELLEYTISTVRNLSGELRPLLLDDFGLEKALEMYLEEFSERAGVAASLKCSGVPLALPKDVELTLYRITQEALANVQRHADAREARVSLTRKDKCLTLVVEDDGRGFDLQTALRGSTPGPHFGIPGMRERANMVKGSFEISSRPGHGATVMAKVPTELEIDDPRKDESLLSW